MTEHDIEIPSGRIRFALEALKEWERMEGTKIDMTVKCLLSI